MSQLIVTDLFLRVTTANGKSHVEHRRTWDAQLCILAVQDEYRKEDEKENRAPTVVTLASRADYEASRNLRAEHGVSA